MTLSDYDDDSEDDIIHSGEIELAQRDSSDERNEQTEPISVPTQPGRSHRYERRDRYEYVDLSVQAPKDISSKITTSNVIGDASSRTLRNRNANLATVPLNFTDATKVSAERSNWNEAIQRELDSLQKRGTFGEPVELPNGARSKGCKWVFTKKFHTDGTLDKYKARLVAQGFSQRQGNEIFAPVAHIAAIRIVLPLAVHKGLSLATVDVSNAYLYSDLKLTEPWLYLLLIL